jgi:hypothetical protein
MICQIERAIRTLAAPHDPATWFALESVGAREADFTNSTITIQLRPACFKNHLKEFLPHLRL